MISVQALQVGELGVNCYIVENTDTAQCVIVDPGSEGERIIRCVGSRTPVAVLLTHGHFDHIGAADEVCAHFGIPLYIHEADVPKLSSARANVSQLFGAPLTVRTAPQTVQEGDVLSLAGIALQVLHTPGHSAGSVCYLLPDGVGLISGDTLFAHGYGRTDFEDGDFAQLCQSLKRLMRLSPPMITYPGHDACGMVGRAPLQEAE